MNMFSANSLFFLQERDHVLNHGHANKTNLTFKALEKETNIRYLLILGLNHGSTKKDVHISAGIRSEVLWVTVGESSTQT